MTWAAAALVDPHPTNALSDVLKTLCGVEPTRNWSFVENIPPWGLNEVQTMTLSNWDAGDTFKLVFDGQTSAAISYASDISAALTAALNAMDADDTLVHHGGPGRARPSTRSRRSQVSSTATWTGRRRHHAGISRRLPAAHPRPPRLFAPP